jgi:pimeloyl-ACP methyl ester carboxylesterase
MKLVLLPGLDGTGDLFAALLIELSEFECRVITLPATGAQDYPSIVEQVKEKLPKDDFVLVAESFSGPIGAVLASKGLPQMKGVIFVASFLSPPKKLLVGFARYLPLKMLSKMPLAGYFHKLLFLGPDASHQLVDLFQQTILSLSPQIIKARLKSIQSLSVSSENLDLPAAYIQALSDRLVPAGKIVEFKSRFENLTVQPIEGPHFILQSKPAECAVAISELVQLLLSQTESR